jgi:hypothetical protein
MEDGDEPSLLCIFKPELYSSNSAASDNKGGNISKALQGNKPVKAGDILARLKQK